MAYNSNIPQPGDLLSTSQPQLLANFQALQTLLDVNHVDFASADQGKHKWLTFPSQGSVPSFASGEMGVFNQNASPSSRNDLWLARGNGTPFPMTGYGISGTSFWTYLPSGFLIVGGNISTNNGTVTITYNNAGSGGIASFPGFTTAAINAQATRVANVSATQFPCIAAAPTLTQLTINSNNVSGSINLYWYVIGL